MMEGLVTLGGSAIAVPANNFGLYAPLIKRPKWADLGMYNTANLSSTEFSEHDMGVTITQPNRGSGDIYAIRYKPAPSPPYTITALLAMNLLASNSGGSGVTMGWYDGTKLHHIRCPYVTGNGPVKLQVSRNSTLSAWAANDGTEQQPMAHPIWVRIKDDGTNVFFQASIDGINFATPYSVAKASGYLGASGYSNVHFGASANGPTTIATMLSYSETHP